MRIKPQSPTRQLRKAVDSARKRYQETGQEQFVVRHFMVHGRVGYMHVREDGFKSWLYHPQCEFVTVVNWYDRKITGEKWDFWTQAKIVAHNLCLTLRVKANLTGGKHEGTRRC